MSKVETTMTVPLTTTQFGTIRVGSSRVTLDSLVHHFKMGATAEQIAHSFPSLELGDVYAVIAYYLANSDSVEEYLRQQEEEADNLEQEIASAPTQQKETSDLRARIRARWAARQSISDSNTD